MALLPLDHLLMPVPAYGWATPLGDIARALAQPGAIAPGHLVVVDAQGHPLGVLPVGRLWATHWANATGADLWADGHLFDCQTWLEPGITVPAHQPLAPPAIARLLTQVQGSPPPALVAVDGNGKYLGLLNPGPLLGWLAEQRSASPWLAPPAGPRPGPGQRAWVLELSHALKTPMTTLLGLSTLLLDSRVGSLSDRQFRYVSLMRQAIRKLTHLVNLLLDWMRLESGQIAINLERVSLAGLGEDLLPSFLSTQPEAGTGTWVKDFALDLALAEAWVMADPLRLRQSLHYGLGYLLGSGVTPGGLVVEPWGPWLSLTLWSATAIAPPAWTLDGSPPFPPGPPTLLEGEAPPATASEDLRLPGLQSLEGLGLLVARRLSHLHRGHLSQINTPAQGCRLTLLLPAPGGASDRATVLIVLACAQEAVIDQVGASLEGSPYRVVVAPSCEALASAQTQLTPPCALLHWDSLGDAPAGADAQAALVQRLGIGRALVLQADPKANSGATLEATPGPELKTLALKDLATQLWPSLDQLCQHPEAPLVGGLTILVIRDQPPAVLPTAVQHGLEYHRCRLLDVDDLQVASLLSRVWQPQAVVIDSGAPVSAAYLEQLAQIPDLTELPWITLVPPIEGVVDPDRYRALCPCPEVLTQPPDQAAISLLRAIAQARAA